MEKNSYVQRMKSFDAQVKIDGFIVQLSTNDTRYSGLDELGTISPSKNRNDLNTSTTIGAIEHIISYARETWNCPVIFYTNTHFNDRNYEVLIDKLY